MNLTFGVLVGIGILLVLIGIAKKPPREPLKRSEINARYDERTQYLPQLSNLFKDYINQVEYLAQHNKQLYNIESYQTYTTNKLYLAWIIYFNNTIFKQIQVDDEELIRIAQLIDTYNSSVKDKRVRKFANGLPSACHIAYSYFITTRLHQAENNRLPMLSQFWFWIGRKRQEHLRKHLNKINIIIQDLLEGAEDEV